MAETPASAPVRLSEQDLELFGAASHDRNPLHTSALYARRTPYGQPVAYGVLGALACLGRLGARPGRSLASLALEFVAPVFVGVEYSVDPAELSPGRVVARLSDGPQVVLKLVATFRDGADPPAPSGPAAAIPARGEPADPADWELVPGLEVAGRYVPDWGRLGRLMERLQLGESGLGASHVAALMWSSYLVGMEVPGRRALFLRLALEFQPGAGSSGPQIEYRARVRTADRRFGLLTLQARLATSGAEWAAGELAAFLRQEVPASSIAAVEALLPRSTALQGKVALVVGASRGLGATLAQALALQGCTALATFRVSAAEAERLKASAAGAPGRIELLRGDGGDLAWCEQVRGRILRDHGRLDYLVCSASPALLPLRLHPRLVGRVNDYLSRSFSLVSVPLAVFLPLVSAQAGRVVTISSSAVEAPPPDWPHYVSAKCAVEGLTRSAAAEHRRVSFLIVRPPRLLTELVNTPLGREGAVPPERVAARIVGGLAGPAAPGRVQLLEHLA